MSNLDMESCSLCEKKSGFYFIPARVSAIYGDGMLGANFENCLSFTKEYNYNYSVDYLRKGYVYILDYESKDEKIQIYNVDENGFLKKEKMGLTYYELNKNKCINSCLKGGEKLGNALLLSVDDIDNERDIFVFFSVCKLNEYVLNKIFKNNEKNKSALFTKVRVGQINYLDASRDNFTKAFKQNSADKVFYNKTDNRYDSIISALSDKGNLNNKKIDKLSIIPIFDIIAVLNDFTKLIDDVNVGLKNKYERQLFLKSSINTFNKIIVKSYESNIYENIRKEVVLQAKENSTNKINTTTTIGTPKILYDQKKLDKNINDLYKDRILKYDSNKIYNESKKYWFENYEKKFNVNEFNASNDFVVSQFNLYDSTVVDYLLNMYVGMYECYELFEYFESHLEVPDYSSEKVFVLSEYLFCINSMLNYQIFFEKILNDFKNSDLITTSVIFKALTLCNKSLEEKVLVSSEYTNSFNLPQEVKKIIKGSTNISKTINILYCTLMSKLSSIVTTFMDGLKLKNNLGHGRTLIQAITGLKFKIIKVPANSEETLQDLILCFFKLNGKSLNFNFTTGFDFSKSAANTELYNKLSSFKFENKGNDSPFTSYTIDIVVTESQKFTALKNVTNSFKDGELNDMVFDQGDVKEWIDELYGFISNVPGYESYDIETGIGITQNGFSLYQALSQLIEYNYTTSDSIMDLIHEIFDSALQLVSSSSELLASYITKVAPYMESKFLYVAKFSVSLLECVNIFYYMTKSSLAGSEGKTGLMLLYLAKAGTSTIALIILMGGRLASLITGVYGLIIFIVGLIIDKLIYLESNNTIQNWLGSCKYGFSKYKFTKEIELEKFNEAFSDLTQTMDQIKWDIYKAS